MNRSPAKISSSRISRTERFVESFPVAGRRAPLFFAGYPSTYRIGMSNLGLHFLYSGLAGTGKYRVDRFFTDTSPLTVEDGSQVSSADALFFSVSYEEDYLNMIRILLEAGIEPFREQREGRPLLIAGGAAVSGNPFPLYDIVDAAVIGEGEDVLAQLAESLAGCLERAEQPCTADIADIPGVIVPGSLDRPLAPLRGSKRGSFAHSVILTPSTVFPDTLLIEINRGCPGNCGFCLATSVYAPFRPASIESLESVLTSSRVPVGKVGLVGTAIAAHPRFFEIIDLLLRRRIGVGLSSLRAEDIDDKKAWLIGRSGTRSVSLAPESGSEELRFRLGKKVTDDQYFKAAGLLARNGIKSMSLYFLTGYPGEDRDTAGLTASFLRKLRSSAHGARVSMHLNVVVPKAWTPFQFHPVPFENELKERILSLKRAGIEAGVDVRVKSLRSSMRQAILSVGGRDTGKAIVEYVSGGISWKKALEKAGVDPLLHHRSRESTGRLPWDGPSADPERERLLGRYRSIL